MDKGNIGIRITASISCFNNKGNGKLYGQKFNRLGLNWNKIDCMKITTRILEDELFESVNEDGHRATIDTRPRGTKAAQSPVELLLTALSACAAVDIVMILKKRRKTITDFKIIADGTRPEEPPRYFEKIHSHYLITSPDVEPEEVHKAAALALEKYCSVGASLKSELTFSVEVRRP